jgi:hypothetical protein
VFFGKTTYNKQRFRCRNCGKTFIWKNKSVKLFNEKTWFRSWIKESYTIRQLCHYSGYSKFKIESIKNYWLTKLPEERFDYTKYKYLIYDGTYFHKNGCLISLMEARHQNIISHIYSKKEGYNNVYQWFLDLREQGLNPAFITMDGELSVIRAINEVWPKTLIQRCLYHIQREGLRWLRTYPKTEAGRALRSLLKSLCRIRTLREKSLFVRNYNAWLLKYKNFVTALPRTEVAFKNLKRTIVLIDNSIPDMFHYLKDHKIHKTTNALEGFYSRLKHDYQQHRGLTEKHKIQYLSWYCHFKNS